MIIVDCLHGYSCHRQDIQVLKHVYVVNKFWQLFSEHSITKVVFPVGWRIVHSKEMLCCVVVLLMPELV